MTMNVNDIHWFLPLDECTSLDAIRARWPALLERQRMTPYNEEPRYRDAILAFLGLSTLAPRLKLATVLALGSGFDIDLRLALGALGAAAFEDDASWPETVADAVAVGGPALPVQTSDAWLGAFVAGRLAGLRDTFRHDGAHAEAWESVFWNAFLEMACRHGCVDAVRLALGRGADPRADGWAAVASAAAAARRHEDDAPAGAETDYADTMRLLLDASAQPQELLAEALDCAAGAGNTAMLDFLLAAGADLRVDGVRALAGAARHLAYDAFDWLHEHGVDARDDEGVVLAAAVSTLDETTVELALAAGADPVAGALPAWRAALSTTPWDLYSAETEFTGWRADIVALLLRHGARPAGAVAIGALRAARDGRQVAALLLRRGDLDADGRELVAQLAALAFGARSAMMTSTDIPSRSLE